MKNYLVFLIIAIFATSVLSCSKSDLGGRQTIHGTITEEYLDGSNYYCWGNGASLSVFPGTTDNIRYDLSSGAKSRKGKFKAQTDKLSGSSIDATIAVSPYNSAASASMADGVATIRTTMPSTITFSEAGYFDAGVCPMIAITGSNSDELPFICPLGGISLKLTGEAVITKVVIKANGGELINGDLVITASKDGVKSVELTGGSSTTTINCDPGIQLTKVAKDFVIFLPYGTYSDGFTITSYSADGDVNVASAVGPRKVAKARVLNVSRQQFVKYSDLNASSTQRANCYLVNSAGGYYLDATVKGNGASGLHETFKDQDPTLSPSGAKLIWEEVTGLVTGVTYADGKIYFACSGKDGNALIGATDDSGNIIWSWHIWSTSVPADITLGNWTFMDRNLGASSVEDQGLYFQWGRKDPISSILGFDDGHGEGKYHPVEGGPSDNENVKNTIAYSVAHPEVYLRASSRNNDWLLDAPQRHLWGLDFSSEGLPDYAPLKTIYDPCPVGYCLPATNAFAAGLDAGKANAGSYITLYAGALKIPASGFIYAGGYGWWGQDSFAGLWSCSTSWGNPDNGFRLKGIDDARDNYDRATGLPVRCVKMQ